jgi:hypothetical protein
MRDQAIPRIPEIAPFRRHAIQLAISPAAAMATQMAPPMLSQVLMNGPLQLERGL